MNKEELQSWYQQKSDKKKKYPSLMRREQKRVLMPETQRRVNSLENMTEGSIQKKKYYTCMCSDVFLYGEVIWKMGIQEIRNRKE